MNKQLMSWPEFESMASEERKVLPVEKIAQAVAHRTLTVPSSKMTASERPEAEKWLPAWRKRLAQM